MTRNAWNRYEEGKARVYISSSINQQSIVTNHRIAQVLRRSGMFQVYLPQESIPSKHHAELERWAPRYCEIYIDKADIILLLMDTYGIDCSWEVGHAHRSKPIVAYVENLESYDIHRQDWMVKYAIGCVITTSRKIARLCNADKMLMEIPTYCIANVETLPRRLLGFFRWKICHVRQEMMMLTL
jgi:nucleoside 2-deoxyribosyltransferase